MAYGKNEPIANVYKRLLDWLDDLANTGGNVTNVCLDLINRAQEELRTYRPWADLVTAQALTLTDKSSSMPADYGEMVRVFSDSDSDNLPEQYYWLRSKRVDDGYIIRDTYTNAAGHSRVITFYRDPTQTVTMEYVKMLEDYVAADVDTSDAAYAVAYSFFPTGLLLTRAQKIHAIEGGVPDANEVKLIEDRERDLLTDYEQSHEFVNIDMRMEMLDDNASIIDVEAWSASDGSDGIGAPYDNDYDHG